MHPDGWVGGPLVGRELGEVVELFLELIPQQKSTDLDPRIDPKLWRTKKDSGQTNGSYYLQFFGFHLNHGWIRAVSEKSGYRERFNVCACGLVQYKDVKA